MSTDKTLENLFNADVEINSEIIFKQYRLYVDMADHISSRRAIANSFYLTANSILVAVMGVMIQTQVLIYMIPFSLIGLGFSVFWIFLIDQYKKLNGAKFQVINKIEEKLPIKGFGKEWELLAQGQRKRVYWPLTHIEILIPSLLVVVYLLLLSISTAILISPM